MSTSTEQNDSIELTVTNSIVDGKTRRVVRLTGGIEIFYEFDRVMPWSEDELLDGYVLAILLYAMRQGKSLFVNGPLSRSAMRNLAELQIVWSRWRPHFYRRIKIIPQSVVFRTSERKEAIAAFAGGVDGTFTAMRHARSQEPNRYPVTTVLMVLGFDVYVDNYEAFNKLIRRATPLFQELDLELRTVRTNSQVLRLQPWQDSFALQFAACLHMFSGEFRYGLMGSSHPYEALTIPWGSTTVTDHLMSGDDFSIIHDGAGFSRTDKVEAIMKSPIASRAVKVCWEGADQGSNCGICEKCIRTRLNFMAAGYRGTPPCFSGEFALAEILKIPLRTTEELRELTAIVAYAKKYNVSGPWLPLIKERIAMWQALNPNVVLNKLYTRK